MSENNNNHKTKVFKLDDTIMFSERFEAFNELPEANYLLNWNDLGACFLTEVPAFNLPKKIYDNDTNFITHVGTTYSQTNSGNIGILLEGYKGQGKSVTAKRLCEYIALPVIIISRKIPQHVDFVTFLKKIPFDFVLFIDEFEKIFRPAKDTEEKMHTEDVFLSFMDGSISSGARRVFLLTTNMSIGDKFINRPSRIRYYRKYDFMEQSLFDSILADKLKNKEYEKDLRENMPLVDCTIDLLTTVIDEINLHDTPYSTFKEFFNHKPKKICYSRYKKEKDKWEFYDNIEESAEVTRDSVYIAGYSAQVRSVEGKYVYYTTRERIYEDEDNDDGKVGDVFYRLEKVDYSRLAF